MEEIVKVLQRTIQKATGIELEITRDLSLLDGGIIDSLSLVTVIQSLQSELDIDIDLADITLENFDSLDVMIPFIKRCLQEK